MDVYTRKGDRIIIKDEPLSSGGEGEIREILSGATDYGNCCIKIYFQKKRTPQQEAKIIFMSDNPPEMITGSGFMIGWPIEPVYDASKSFLGFIMPLAFDGSRQLVNLTALKISRRLGEAWHEKYDRSSRYALLCRLKLMHNIAIPIYLLHHTGKYVLKDFKPQNVLVTHDGKVTIVDMDSVQICDNGKLLFPGTAATDLYIPTEFYTCGTGGNASIPIDKSWDNFALGVVFYQILFGLHPYVVTPKEQKDADSNEISSNISSDLFPFGHNADKIQGYPTLHDKFKVLPTEVQTLFRRCFNADPANRPSADEWGMALNAIIKKAGNLPKPEPKPIPKPEPRTRHDTTPDKSHRTDHPAYEDKPSAGLNLISFFVPVAGWVLYFVFKDEKPNRAKACSRWGWIGFGVLFIFNLILVATGYYYYY